VIMVTHNRLEYTAKTLESLIKTVPLANIYVMDNDSSEEMKDFLKNYTSMSSITRVHLLPKNQGWGSAVNRGLELVEQYFGGLRDYVLVSNNDVEYFDGWLDTCIGLYEKYPQIGILGVWKHNAHGVLEDKGDLIIKDQMPAVGWLLKPENIKKIGAFPEHGPCATKGGNGEDVEYCIRCAQQGLLVCGPKDDVADHFDGM